jgi:hypothetical protein
MQTKHRKAGAGLAGQGALQCRVARGSAGSRRSIFHRCAQQRDPLPSILDLESSTCGARQRPVAMTAGDLAFLKALYFHNTGIGPTLSRDDIQLNMLR